VSQSSLAPFVSIKDQCAVKPVDREKMVRYRDRVDACLDAMRFIDDDPGTYRDAVALLAVHSGIALADAIQVGCTESRLKNQVHRKTVKELRNLCGRRAIDDAGVNYFDWLVGKKTEFS
jgi:hypothetical protein